MNCLGPCLSHCYFSDSILLILIGILIGYNLSNYNNKNINK